jgi:2-haloacid dehalogenase
MTDSRFDGFEVLTMDCYGTLIDWESGILGALRPILTRRQQTIADEDILMRYAQLEAEAEAGGYLSYRGILTLVLAGLGRTFGFDPSEEELAAFSDSVRNWPPFGDSSEALRRLQTRFKLAVLSNIDDDLFAASARLLGVEFDYLFTAQQIGSYKPNPANFRFAINKIGLPANRILHVAQSLYHDIVPATQAGLTTVWINRRKGVPGSGATPPAEARPTFEFADLRSFAEAVL